jgi:hypothetical protein
MSDLWVEATRDIEAENAAEAMTRAKMRVASLWPFLAQSKTEREFEHRLALAEPRIDNLVPDAVQREHVIAAFREDYGIYRQAEDIYATEPVEHTASGGGGTTGNAPLRIFHEASGQWITIEGAAQPTPQNVNNHIEPEDGPITGNTGTFPVMVNGPDPHDPIQDQFPMQPSPWTPSNVWVERPMNFAPYQHPYAKTSAADAHPPHPGHYESEGVETGPGPNPYYFSGGGEGAAGNQQAGFPIDVTLPEPDERVDAYGTPPVQSSGSSGGDVPYSNPHTAKDNHGKCAGDDCGRPVFRRGNTWHHLDGEQDHHVLLDRDHPWVQQRLSARQGSIIQMAPGTVLKQAGFYDPADPSVQWLQVTADVSSSDQGPDSGDGGAPSGGATPDPPPSMISGGPGAQAMEPMTIPGPNSTTNPFSPGSGGGGGQQQMPMMGMPAAPMQPMARFVPRQQRFADVRERPTQDNPNGVGDEFESNNWEKPLEMTPRQAPEMRGVNTPQRPKMPIPQVSSDGLRDDEDEERE